MKKIILVTALSGLLVPAVAFAELSYDAASLGYAKTSESGSADLNELDLGIAKGIAKNVYVSGSYATGSQASGTPAGDVSINGYGIGLGYHTPINENADFILKGGFIHANLKLGSISASGNGYEVGVGFRAEMSPRLEGSAFATHTSVNANSSTTTGNGVDAELAFNITHEFQLFARIGTSTSNPDTGSSYTDNTVSFGLYYYY
jgi:hypothetical protein